VPANRLIRENSPYLLQHAHNPVDWYPWGDEAFAEARSRDVPIFLSIGYATCHWCHVMERESFEDPEVARLMNEAFVNVKVDREERPDIDGIYMTVAQITSGQGGWPLTIVMTPDRVPFFAATYIPRQNRHGRAGMLEIIPRLQAAWRDDRETLLAAGDSIRAHLDRLSASDFAGRELDADIPRQAFRELAGSFDREHAGFGGAPRFPTPHRLLFLLRYWRRTGVPQARDMVEDTLDAMRAGGVFDQLGFGFHRYSTDRRWLLPHFEKMLYDQAMLMLAYAESYQAEASERRERVIREIAEYVLRDLTSPDGAFFSAEDADSEGEEGRYYVWTSAELPEVLGEADARIAATAWGMRDEGNYREEATGDLSGRNILHLPRPVTETAALVGRDPEELASLLESARTRLLHRRAARPRPLLDDKVLADWNGLMIAALARGGRVLDEPELVRAAVRAADFLHERMWRDDGLLHRFRDGRAGIDGNLDDYAFLAWGEIELHQATLDPGRLRLAVRVTDAMIERFHDAGRGGFYFSPAGSEDLLVRRREAYDGAIPSGNSVAMYNLARLARLTGRPRYEELAHEVAAAFSRQVAAHPSAFTFLLIALDLLLGPSEELVIAGEPGSPDTEALLRVAWSGYHPNRTVLLRPPGEAGEDLGEMAPFTAAMGLEEGRATAYLCHGFVCERPVTDPAELKALLSPAG